jgi:hypothetical protein
MLKQTMVFASKVCYPKNMIIRNKRKQRLDTVNLERSVKEKFKKKSFRMASMDRLAITSVHALADIKDIKVNST